MFSISVFSKPVEIMGIKIEPFLKDDKSMQKVFKLTDTKLDRKSFFTVK